MNIRYFSLCLLMFATLLISCSPVATTPTASPTLVPTIAATIALLIPPAATATTTATALPAAEPVSGFVSIQMLGVLNGWSWIGLPNGEFRLLHTIDGGLAWKDVTPMGFPPAFSNAFFLDAATAWVPLVNDSVNATLLTQTLDGGKSWRQMSARLPFTHASLHFQDEKIGWAVVADMGAGNAHYQVFDTHDGGTNWSPVSMVAPANEADAQPNTIHLCNICGDTFYYDPKRIVVTQGDMGSMAPGGAVRLSVSQNAGQSWLDLRLPLPSIRYQDGLVTPLAPVFFPEGVGILPVRIQKTNNDGSSIYAIEAFYRTQDGGLTWQSPSVVIENVVSSEPPLVISPASIILRCGSKLCRSLDAGKTWEAINPNISFAANNPDQFVSAFQFLDPQTGWAIFNSEGISMLYHTINGGVTWVEVDTRAVITIQ